MKQEIEIVKENVELEAVGTSEGWWRCEEHKETLERWLDFLENLCGIFKTNKQSSTKLDEKIKDIKLAIEMYNKNEI